MVADTARERNCIRGFNRSKRGFISLFPSLSPPTFCFPLLPSSQPLCPPPPARTSARIQRSTSSRSPPRALIQVRRVDLTSNSVHGPRVHGALNLNVLTPCAAAPAEQPVKRKRGRPPGSKNKKTVLKEQASAAAAAAATGSSTGAGPSGEAPVKRGRGRPPKVRSQSTA